MESQEPNPGSLVDRTAAEHLGKTIAATPLALPLIQDSRIFEPNFNCMGMLEPADPEDF